jgi:hypothetical protein
MLIFATLLYVYIANFSSSDIMGVLLGLDISCFIGNDLENIIWNILPLTA